MSDKKQTVWLIKSIWSFKLSHHVQRAKNFDKTSATSDHKWKKIAIECVNNDRHCSFSAREILFRDTIEAIIIFYNRVLNLIVGVESVGPNDRDGNEIR